jgi:putative nucleotidyltransferase with HDIG domain
MTIPSRIRYTLYIQPIDLPVFNPVALDIVKLLEDPYTDILNVVSAINEDQSLSAQVLRMSNSPAYAGRARCETIKNAAIRLGARQMSNLAMAASHASLHASESPLINEIMQDLWLHSHACALGCRSVALSTGQQDIADKAYMAGLLHDIGKLYILKAMERISQMLDLKTVLEKELLQQVFSEMHVELGTRVMEHWNLPPVYRDVVACHHAEHYDTSNILLAIVRMVNFNSRSLQLDQYPTLTHQAENAHSEANPLYMDDSVWTKMKEAMTGSLTH